MSMEIEEVLASAKRTGYWLGPDGNPGSDGEIDENNEQDLGDFEALAKRQRREDVLPGLRLDIAPKFFDLDGAEFIQHQEHVWFKVDTRRNVTKIKSEALPRLKCPADELHNNLVALDLSTNFTKHVMISDDYFNYHKLKWDTFMDLLQQTELIKKLERHTIVTFSGVIANLLKLPAAHRESWNLDVWLENGIIFMKRFRDDPSEFTNRRPFVQEDNQPPRPSHLHRLLKLKNLAIGGSVDAALDENEKTFSIFSTIFGPTKMLLLKEVDALDENDQEIKLVLRGAYDDPNGHREKNFMSKKLPDLWAQAQVTGRKTHIVTAFSNDNTVDDIEVFKDEELWDGNEKYIKVNRCRDFLKRFFAFLMNHVKELKEDQQLRLFFQARQEPYYVNIRVVKGNEE